MPLIDTTIRNAKAADKPRKLADEKGLYLLVNTIGKYGNSILGSPPISCTPTSEKNVKTCLSGFVEPKRTIP